MNIEVLRSHKSIRFESEKLHGQERHLLAWGFNMKKVLNEVPCFTRMTKAIIFKK